MNKRESQSCLFWLTLSLSKASLAPLSLSLSGLIFLFFFFLSLGFNNGMRQTDETFLQQFPTPLFFSSFFGFLVPKLYNQTSLALFDGKIFFSSLFFIIFFKINIFFALLSYNFIK
jgi:hypothetical protein